MLVDRNLVVDHVRETGLPAHELAWPVAVVDDLTRCLVSPREETADHHHLGSRRQRLCHVARMTNATVGYHGQSGPGDVKDGRQLPHTRPGDQARRAEATRPDPDPHVRRHRFRFEVRPCLRRRRDVPGHEDDLGKVRVRLQGAECPDQSRLPAMRDIDQDHPHPCIGKCAGKFDGRFGSVTKTDRIRTPHTGTEPHPVGHCHRDRIVATGPEGAPAKFLE